MKKILLVEGKSDVAFVRFICEHYSILLDDDKKIIDMQGKGGLAKNLISLRPEIEKGVKIAVILDADSDFGKRKSKVEKELRGSSVSFFLIPNHSEPGDLETLLLSTVDNDDNILKCFDEYIVCLKEKSINIRSINNKAKLYAYTSLSCGIKPDESFKSSLDLWDIENRKFQPIIDFVCNFYKAQG